MKTKPLNVRAGSFELSFKSEKDAMEIDVIISSLAITEDSDRLLEIGATLFAQTRRYIAITFVALSWRCGSKAWTF